jgi:serine protease AprX
VLGDVWIAYAMRPADAVDLLITPHKTQAAGPVAVKIAKRLDGVAMSRGPGQASEIAYLQGLVAARLFFEELMRVIVPMTQWWHERKKKDDLKKYAGDSQLDEMIQAVIDWTRAETEDEQIRASNAFAAFNSLDRYVSLAAIILWAATEAKKKKAVVGAADALAKLKSPAPIVKRLGEVFAKFLESPDPDPPQIWQVSLNRKAMPALSRSVPSVKGDAARTLFKVRCESIHWAVLDSGIDAKHPAFNDENGESRVMRAFDFSNIRKIVSLDNLDTNTPAFRKQLAELREGKEKNLSAKEATRILKALAEDAENDRSIHWELVEPFITIDSTATPSSGHGTHVAGIIGAAANGNTQFADGMCPDIKFYDFRVLGRTMQDTEFAIIAALQYLRYLNERHTYVSIHGANLSLSIPHDVRNFACGRTPICNESERLVESGVVVVAAAGNLGYQRFETKEGSYEGYTAFSVTDPGNADGVITVGATHRYRPHTYGVSFFSSRGPTGDGRLKPDLVAPGERVESALLGGTWGELDGTSMAAPHVSGAAAMLMARYDELIGEPRRIKRILCESATDLGRERSFQGHGMLDVLRAFQSI